MGVTQTTKKTPCAGARVLVVDDEPAMRDVFRDLVARALGCKLTFAATMREARNVLNNQSIDLLVADVNLPDGNGLALLPELNRVQPGAAAIVITGQPSVDGAVTALRSGAIDFVSKPFTIPQLTKQLQKAIQIQQLRQRQQNRLRTLKEAVKRLNAARKTVSKKVDLLCNDLITAYGELSKQLDVVRSQEGFRSLMGEAKDLEQMLCHAMDWLLRQLGYANVAIWLTGDDGAYQLGAYMKYTTAGEPALTEAMKAGILKEITNDGFVHLSADEARDRLTKAELQFIPNQTVMGVTCTYLGEALATIVLFRDGKTPFTDDDANALKTISPVFATSLAAMVHDEDGEDDSDGGGFLLDDGPLDDTDNPPKGNKNPKRRKTEEKNDADWWKRGEAPPF